ncbi:methyl-accepting chemotaxis protein [Bacillus luti]|nr:methyl-accepting chemotaxis protein [Bacillus cereus]HDR8330043.1 methyl-accepting chemotaxis protein [Bacillus cereus]HDR8337265.1 methyl-accepting chemotaxis protein [Bacillus cereus]
MLLLKSGENSMDQELLIERNQKMFRFNLVFILSNIVVCLLSKKHFDFMVTLSILSAFFLITSYIFTYKWTKYASLPAYHNLIAYFCSWFYLTYQDPSMNKFIFVFTFAVLGTLYQDRKIAGLLSGLSIFAACYFYFFHKDSIYGGYDHVEIKSLFFTLFDLAMIILIISVQMKHSNKLFKNSVKQADEQQKMRKETEQLLEALQKQNSKIVGFQQSLNEKMEKAKSNNDGTYAMLKQLNDLFSEQNEIYTTNKQVIQSFSKEFDSLQHSAQHILTLNAESQTIIKGSVSTLDDLSISTSSFKQTLHKTVNTSNEMVRKTESIEQMVKHIIDIANRTDLLALNANIEAANAGIHGKGFSVVAAEVKKLAVNSSALADEINEVLSSIKHQSLSHKEDMDNAFTMLLTNEKDIISVQNAFGKIKDDRTENDIFLEDLSKKFKGLLGLFEEFYNRIHTLSSMNETTASSLGKMNETFDVMNATVIEINDDFQKLKNINI